MRALLLLAPALIAAAPAPHLLTPGDRLGRIANLAPGTRTYVRYRQAANGTVTIADYQTKTIAIDGPVMTITQRWQGAKGSLDLTSRVDSTTLAPVDHRRVRTSEGKSIAEQFAFAGPHVTGTAAARDGSLGPIDLTGPVTPYNFELDLETLAALSWGKGRAYDIPFYHPGGGAPQRYRFTATGESVLNAAGSTIPTWVVTTDYGRPESGQARFFIAKSGGTVLRVEQSLPDGSLSVKALVVTPAA